ncbi:transcription antitermination factor NusB [Allobranchiibius sp. CTAmp26]|uniref:transcription antitermination factor NusB n=1 Tax=Allobranchiibius sp. CTAmp26 TaxID=2815214 RepID=UPI001AA1C3A0|nr:transcription antitermination factor NusB [Allobranchiibius sp. CTAmp26]MBO1754285.1 transcription antitermination factor NusB [Allobranchiibius sp. CTAmp26]
MGARTKARKRALDLLFEAEQRGVNAVILLDERVADPVTPAPLPEYTADLVRGVVAHWSVINETIQTYTDWPMDRMPAVDRALLRLAVWELAFNDDVPEKVAIAEATHLAGELSTDASPQFMSGLLTQVAQVKHTLA